MEKNYPPPTDNNNYYTFGQGTNSNNKNNNQTNNNQSSRGTTRRKKFFQSIQDARRQTSDIQIKIDDIENQLRQLSRSHKSQQLSSSTGSIAAAAVGVPSDPTIDSNLFDSDHHLNCRLGGCSDELVCPVYASHHHRHDDHRQKTSTDGGCTHHEQQYFAQKQNGSFLNSANAQQRRKRSINGNAVIYEAPVREYDDQPEQDGHPERLQRQGEEEPRPSTSYSTSSTSSSSEESLSRKARTLPVRYFLEREKLAKARMKEEERVLLASLLLNNKNDHVEANSKHRKKANKSSPRRNKKPHSSTNKIHYSHGNIPPPKISLYSTAKDQHQQQDGNNRKSNNNNNSRTRTDSFRQKAAQYDYYGPFSSLHDQAMAQDQKIRQISRLHRAAVRQEQQKISSQITNIKDGFREKTNENEHGNYQVTSAPDSSSTNKKPSTIIPPLLLASDSEDALKDDPRAQQIRQMIDQQKDSSGDEDFLDHEREQQQAVSSTKKPSFVPPISLHQHRNNNNNQQESSADHSSLMKNKNRRDNDDGEQESGERQKKRLSSTSTTTSMPSSMSNVDNIDSVPITAENSVVEKSTTATKNGQQKMISDDRSVSKQSEAGGKSSSEGKRKSQRSSNSNSQFGRSSKESLLEKSSGKEATIPSRKSSTGKDSQHRQPSSKQNDDPRRQLQSSDDSRKPQPSTTDSRKQISSKSYGGKKVAESSSKTSETATSIRTTDAGSTSSASASSSATSASTSATSADSNSTSNGAANPPPNLVATSSNRRIISPRRIRKKKLQTEKEPEPVMPDSVKYLYRQRPYEKSELRKFIERKRKDRRDERMNPPREMRMDKIRHYEIGSLQEYIKQQKRDMRQRMFEERQGKQMDKLRKLEKLTKIMKEQKDRKNKPLFELMLIDSIEKGNRSKSGVSSNAKNSDEMVQRIRNLRMAEKLAEGTQYQNHHQHQHKTQHQNQHQHQIPSSVVVVEEYEDKSTNSKPTTYTDRIHIQMSQSSLSLRSPPHSPPQKDEEEIGINAALSPTTSSIDDNQSNLVLDHGQVEEEKEEDDDLDFSQNYFRNSYSSQFTPPPAPPSDPNNSLGDSMQQKTGSLRTEVTDAAATDAAKEEHCEHRFSPNRQQEQEHEEQQRDVSNIVGVSFHTMELDQTMTTVSTPTAPNAATSTTSTQHIKNSNVAANNNNGPNPASHQQHIIINTTTVNDYYHGAGRPIFRDADPYTLPRPIDFRQDDVLNVKKEDLLLNSDPETPIISYSSSLDDERDYYHQQQSDITRNQQRPIERNTQQNRQNSPLNGRSITVQEQQNAQNNNFNNLPAANKPQMTSSGVDPITFPTEPQGQTEPVNNNRSTALNGSSFQNNYLSTGVGSGAAARFSPSRTSAALSKNPTEHWFLSGQENQRLVTVSHPRNDQRSYATGNDETDDRQIEIPVRRTNPTTTDISSNFRARFALGLQQLQNIETHLRHLNDVEKFEVQATSGQQKLALEYKAKATEAELLDLRSKYSLSAAQRTRQDTENERQIAEMQQQISQLLRTSQDKKQQEEEKRNSNAIFATLQQNQLEWQKKMDLDREALQREREKVDIIKAIHSIQPQPQPVAPAPAQVPSPNPVDLSAIAVSAAVAAVQAINSSTSGAKGKKRSKSRTSTSSSTPDSNKSSVLSTADSSFKSSPNSPSETTPSPSKQAEKLKTKKQLFREESESKVEFLNETKTLAFVQSNIEKPSPVNKSETGNNNQNSKKPSKTIEPPSPAVVNRQNITAAINNSESLSIEEALPSNAVEFGPNSGHFSISEEIETVSKKSQTTSTTIQDVASTAQNSSLSEEIKTASGSSRLIKTTKEEESSIKTTEDKSSDSDSEATISDSPSQSISISLKNNEPATSKKTLPKLSSVEREDSFNRSISESSETEGRILALKSDLNKKREIAAKLKAEYRKKSKEHLRATEESLTKQIKLYDEFIRSTTGQIHDLEKGSGGGRPATPPRIMSPRVIEEESVGGSPRRTKRSNAPPLTTAAIPSHPTVLSRSRSSSLSDSYASRLSELKKRKSEERISVSPTKTSTSDGTTSSSSSHSLTNPSKDASCSDIIHTAKSSSVQTAERQSTIDEVPEDIERDNQTAEKTFPSSSPLTAINSSSKPSSQIKTEASGSSKPSSPIKTEASASKDSSSPIKTEASVSSKTDSQIKTEASASSKPSSPIKTEASVSTKTDSQIKTEASEYITTSSAIKTEASEEATSKQASIADEISEEAAVAEVVASYHSLSYSESPIKTVSNVDGEFQSSTATTTTKSTTSTLSVKAKQQDQISVDIEEVPEEIVEEVQTTETESNVVGSNIEHEKQTTEENKWTSTNTNTSSPIKTLSKSIEDQSSVPHEESIHTEEPDEADRVSSSSSVQEEISPRKDEVEEESVQEESSPGKDAVEESAVEEVKSESSTTIKTASPDEIDVKSEDRSKSVDAEESKQIHISHSQPLEATSISLQKSVESVANKSASSSIEEDIESEAAKDAVGSIKTASSVESATSIDEVKTLSFVEDEASEAAEINLKSDQVSVSESNQDAAASHRSSESHTAATKSNNKTSKSAGDEKSEPTMSTQSKDENSKDEPLLDTLTDLEQKTDLGKAEYDENMVEDKDAKSSYMLRQDHPPVIQEDKVDEASTTKSDRTPSSTPEEVPPVDTHLNAEDNKKAGTKSMPPKQDTLQPLAPSASLQTGESFIQSPRLDDLVRVSGSNQPITAQSKPTTTNQATKEDQSTTSTSTTSASKDDIQTGEDLKVPMYSGFLSRNPSPIPPADPTSVQQPPSSSRTPSPNSKRPELQREESVEVDEDQQANPKTTITTAVQKNKNNDIPGPPTRELPLELSSEKAATANHEDSSSATSSDSSSKSGSFDTQNSSKTTEQKQVGAAGEQQLGVDNKSPRMIELPLDDLKEEVEEEEDPLEMESPSTNRRTEDDVSSLSEEELAQTITEPTPPMLEKPTEGSLELRLDLNDKSAGSNEDESSVNANQKPFSTVSKFPVPEKGPPSAALKDRKAEMIEKMKQDTARPGAKEERASHATDSILTFLLNEVVDELFEPSDHPNTSTEAPHMMATSTGITKPLIKQKSTSPRQIGSTLSSPRQHSPRFQEAWQHATTTSPRRMDTPIPEVGNDSDFEKEYLKGAKKEFSPEPEIEPEDDDDDDWEDDDFGLSKSKEKSPRSPQDSPRSPKSKSSTGRLTSDVFSVVPHTSKDVTMVIDQVAEQFWTARRYGEEIENLAEPSNGALNVPIDGTRSSGNLNKAVDEDYRRMLFLWCKEIALEALDQKMAGAHVTDPSETPKELLKIPYFATPLKITRLSKDPPRSAKDLAAILKREVLSRLDVDRDRHFEEVTKTGCPRTRRWRRVCRKKPNRVDEIVYGEMYDEEDDWIDYSSALQTVLLDTLDTLETDVVRQEIDRVIEQ